MSRVLRHGQFFGELERDRAVDGFALSLRTPDPDRDVVRHTHEEAHFILLLDGHYRSSARDGGDFIGPALIYNPPGTTHRDSFPERDGRFLAISVTRARLAEAADAVPLLERATRLHHPGAIGAAGRLARLCTRSRASDAAAEVACLELLGETVPTPAAPHRHPPRWLRVVREVLHDRLAEDVSIGEIAETAGVHRVHLARAFRQFYGCAPAEYVRRCRVERAAVEVRTTERSLAEIAAGCGFVDQAHLSRWFVRALATTPARYRRRFRT